MLFHINSYKSAFLAKITSIPDRFVALMQVLAFMFSSLADRIHPTRFDLTP